MTKDEALDLALETLMLEHGSIYDKAITAIKQARSAPVQEPVAIDADMRNVLHGALVRSGKVISPPAAQRQWVGLTDEERTEIRREHYARTLPLMDAVEAKLKELNT
jgi:hypothetical protein